MRVLLHIPVALSALLIAAHFLRTGELFLVALCIGLPLLLLFRQRSLVRIVQGGLVLSSMVWLHTLHGLVSMRVALGQPSFRLMLILGGVALFTLASAFVFESQTLRRVYGVRPLPLSERG